MKASREEVYKAIDSERNYQDHRWSPETTRTGGQHSIDEWILYMEHYLTEARSIATRLPADAANREGLPFIRKVTAMGVACMEQNGAPMRERFEC